MAEHAFYTTLMQGSIRHRWSCRCGVVYGQQPTVSQAKARREHRAHVAAVAVQEVHDELTESPG